jgi:RNA polymerase sigma-70 factor (ECF subfamily)
MNTATRATPHADTSTAFASLVEAHRAYLARIARRKLRDAADVEDVVQETLIAAWQARSGFRGQSALRTWLVGILQHKIVDLVRERTRRPTVSLDAVEGLEWAEHGAMGASPGTAGSVALAAAHAAEAAQQDGVVDLLERRELCTRVLSELESYSPKAARIFVLREIDGEPTAAICRQLAVSDANCYVLLHRARQFVQQRFAGEAIAA